MAANSASTPDVEPEPEPEPVDVETLLESVSQGRVTVSRVLEYHRGEREARTLRGTDWLNAINHARRDRDRTIVLYNETTDPMAGVSALAVGAYGAIERACWHQAFGFSHNGLHHDDAAALLDGRGLELLTLDEARERFRAFVDEHDGPEGDSDA